MSESIADLLSESIATLRQQIPAALHGLCRPLQGRSVLLEVDDERVRIVFEPRDAVVQPPADADGDEPVARIRTSRRTILEVLDARTDVHQAVLAGDLEAVAELDDLVTLNQALAAYLHGAVRSPGFPGLVERLRAPAAAVEPP